MHVHIIHIPNHVPCDFIFKNKFIDYTSLDILTYFERRERISAEVYLSITFTTNIWCTTIRICSRMIWFTYISNTYVSSATNKIGVTSFHWYIYLLHAISTIELKVQFKPIRKHVSRRDFGESFCFAILKSTCSLNAYKKSIHIQHCKPSDRKAWPNSIQPTIEWNNKCRDIAVTTTRRAERYVNDSCAVSQHNIAIQKNGSCRSVDRQIKNPVWKLI